MKHDELTRQTVDDVLARYRPGRTYDGSLFLVNRSGRVPFGGRPDRVRGVIAAAAMQNGDDVLPPAVSRSVYDVLVGRAEAAEAEATPLDDAEPVDSYDDIPEEDGAELLDDVVAFITRYLMFAMDEHAQAIALWAAHTHVHDVFTSTPRLLVRAPTIECGKTRVLEAIQPLVPGPRLAVSVSGAYLFRTIGREAVTILLDEYDTVWRDRSDQGQDLRAIVDAGYRKGATVGRVVTLGNDHVPADFPIFCPFALAGTGWVPDSVQSRSITINMRRRLPNEVVESFDHDEAWQSAEPLARRLRAWALRTRDRLNPRPLLPEGLEDRPAEVWRPLFGVAEAVGGPWPTRAEAACGRLMGDRGEADLNTLLLVHIRAVFDGIDVTSDGGAEAEAETPEPVDTIQSADLVTRLCGREDWPWDELGGGGLTAPGLAKRLRDFGIGPKKFRAGKQTRRGYGRGQFREAWERFIPAPETALTNAPDLAATTGTSGTSLVRPVPPRESVPVATGTRETPATPPTWDVPVVALMAGKSGGFVTNVFVGDADAAGRYKMAAARRAAGQPLDDSDRAALAAADETPRDGDPPTDVRRETGDTPTR